ncbi:hypothetical protein PFICI_12653 [Pestalotiopsis fici W106-1]|uniref:2EXR domain-containing protein n=1 Tax=Pestalotiopsis fici (strain W106-1 / CGMCC3.15140) TaxID=1229662 RepID=W3WPH7_PESFW|nr:uncharacterized protein PFICI_12653 [Pestalotiopsis fici W106-1]ETS75709.1 hypothetical protein PFICI_12653 [Pestalotiopsis fici W106-1]
MTSRVSAPGSKSPFDKLPTELKEFIWQYSMPEHVPEIAILPAGLRPITPLGPRPDDSAEHSLVIKTAYPVGMHVCREWRVFAMARTAFRYSQFAMMDVPTRPFRPDLDILYIPALVSNPVWFSNDSRCEAVHHIAMQSETFLNYGARSLALMTYFRNMDTLTIILPASVGRHPLKTTFPAPRTRCRLRQIDNPALNDIDTLAVIQDCGQGNEPQEQEAKVSAFLHWVEMVVQRTAQYLQATRERDPNELVEAKQSRLRRPFRAFAQTFVEYRYRNGTAHWEETPGGMP